MPRDLSANLPASVRVTFPGRACEKATTAPWSWSAEVAIGDAGPGGAGTGSDAVLGLVDTCAAVFKDATPTTNPSNAATLADLANLTAHDVWQWRTAAYDRAYAGTIGPDLSALDDTVTWSYRADDASTRLTSAPPDDAPGPFNHADPEHDCPDCVGVYGPAAARAGGQVALKKYKVCLEAGEVVARPDGQDSFNGCCDCPGPITIAVTYSACVRRLNLAVRPISVQVTGPGGFSAAATVTYRTFGTPPNQTYSADAVVGGITTPGTYTFAATGADFFDATTAVAVANLCGPASASQALYPKNYAVTVLGCNALPQPGATVVLSYPGGGGSGTTDANGLAILGLSAPILGPDGIYLTVIAPRWQACTLNITAQCGGVIVDMPQSCQPEDCYICCQDSGAINPSCVELTTDRRSVTSPVGGKTVTIGGGPGVYGDAAHKVTFTVPAYRVAPNPLNPAIAQRYIDPNTGQPVVEALPVDFYLSATCSGIVGVHYAVYASNPVGLNPGQKDAAMRNGYALASPSTVGASQLDPGQFFVSDTAGGNGIGDDGTKAGGRNSCSPRSDYGHELVTGRRYTDGMYTSDEAGCAGGPYDLPGDPDAPDDDLMALLHPGPAEEFA